MGVVSLGSNLVQASQTSGKHLIQARSTGFERCRDAKLDIKERMEVNQDASNA